MERNLNIHISEILHYGKEKNNTHTHTVKIYEKELLTTKEEKSHPYDPAPEFEAGFSWVTLDLHWLI